MAAAVAYVGVVQTIDAQADQSLRDKRQAAYVQFSADERAQLLAAYEYVNSQEQSLQERGDLVELERAFYDADRKLTEDYENVYYVGSREAVDAASSIKAVHDDIRFSVQEIKQRAEWDRAWFAENPTKKWPRAGNYRVSLAANDDKLLDLRTEFSEAARNDMGSN